MSLPSKMLKRKFSAEVMNRMWDLSNAEYKVIIRRHQEMEAQSQQARAKEGRWTIFKWSAVPKNRR